MHKIEPFSKELFKKVHGLAETALLKITFHLFKEINCDDFILHGLCGMTRFGDLTSSRLRAGGGQRPDVLFYSLQRSPQSENNFFTLLNKPRLSAIVIVIIFALISSIRELVRLFSLGSVKYAHSVKPLQIGVQK